jgi:Domain of unknown function (DUF222)
MNPGPAPPDPGPDPDSSDQALAGRDEAWESWLASRERREDDEPLEFEDEGDYHDGPDELAEIIAEARQGSADQAVAEAHIAASGQTAALAAGASAALGRRGPGMPGSAEPLVGEYSGPGGAFATGQALDLAPGGPVLLGHADWVAGDDDRFHGASDDELLGIICAADRCEAAASALKHTAVAELIRRRPASGCTPQGPAGMPETWDEFTRAELAPALAESRYAVDGLLDLAHELAVKLPGTMALFRVGVISRYKAQVISHATQLLDPAEARAAEAMVLDRAGRLTPGALRAAIARAVMEVAPEKARKRREKAAKSADVQQWAEFSGNVALAGRELPPADVLAAGQRIDSRAGQLKAAGLQGSAGELRARAFLDLLLGKDSRPDKAAADGAGPAAFVATINLTIPLATLLGLADRPGEIPGIGPIDPWLARDLARSAASHPKTKWCVTVTDKQGHTIGHGCARPEPRGRKKGPRRQKGPGPPGYTFTAADQHGPPGGYGAWRLRAPGDGPDLRISLDPLNTPDCDHRFQARGHDPGVKLKHLSQIRHATCAGPCCRRPSSRSDFEHNVPYEAGGRTCLCNGGPKCRYDHRLKQNPRWHVDQLPDGTFRWTTPSGRQYTTEPTRYPT